jgi:UDPglucose 6-dehydrogenase
MDPAWLGDIVEVRAVVDGRHALDPVAWRAADWDYRALGISSPSTLPVEGSSHRGGAQPLV